MVFFSVRRRKEASAYNRNREFQGSKQRESRNRVNPSNQGRLSTRGDPQRRYDVGWGFRVFAENLNVRFVVATGDFRCLGL